MGLSRWEPFGELRRMREEMDRMFENVMHPTPALQVIAPPVDVFERDNNVIVKVDVPGLKVDDLQVTATDDTISIRGEFKEETETREEGYFRRERQAGKFQRVIPMPATIKLDDVKASFKDGILEVTAPKAETSTEKEKNIQIEA